ncbi:hypothetical protein CC1G_15436 [Coprinopsis cinerea okayama7|uniref:Uncharacterized protein n=1 Tax=Coprinopsis cinerea (strain Okayama-7 / 130 / ATCC MYA-4618 / FGSC 9003) TaxID=240176 RepID=D6RQN9_COPC7|nr:hypothetical protein CC1G_15436 [Coprinopsis cinerea okayama7\|eukprot:XP_002910159.1 hypothetical protein CC1G_15436 [Coprinopsis cinerea okayama7\
MIAIWHPFFAADSITSISNLGLRINDFPDDYPWARIPSSFRLRTLTNAYPLQASRTRVRAIQRLEASYTPIEYAT